MLRKSHLLVAAAAVAMIAAPVAAQRERPGDAPKVEASADARDHDKSAKPVDPDIALASATEDAQPKRGSVWSAARSSITR